MSANPRCSIVLSANVAPSSPMSPESRAIESTELSVGTAAPSKLSTPAASFPAKKPRSPSGSSNRRRSQSKRRSHLPRRRWPHQHHGSRSGTCPSSAAYQQDRSFSSSTKSIRRNKPPKSRNSTASASTTSSRFPPNMAAASPNYSTRLQFQYQRPKNKKKMRLSEIRVAIIGRPNVGKSTLLNRLVGQERAMVSPIAGTTRDAVDSVIQHEDLTIRFVDTAGIRRKGKTELKAEKLSVVMARRHLERSDVAILVIDGVEGVTALDAHIGGYAHEAGRSVIIVVNKWDLVAENPSHYRGLRNRHPREAEVSLICTDRLHFRQDRPARPEAVRSDQGSPQRALCSDSDPRPERIPATGDAYRAADYRRM